MIKMKKIIPILIIVGLFLCSSMAYASNNMKDMPRPELDGSNVTGECYKVIDGDTIYVSGLGKVRFVGVNTPERGEEGYYEAKNYVKERCLGKMVTIDVDNAKHFDKYNRTLGVVYVDDSNLNQELLEKNLAEIMYIPPSEFNPYSWAV